MATLTIRAALERTTASLLGRENLHRAIVSLPDHLCEPVRPLQELVVFFGAPAGINRGDHLARLLSLAWGVDASTWRDAGFIYNIQSAADLLRNAMGSADTGELRLFETGAGGDEGIGPDRIHYARAADIEIFATPRVAARLRKLSAQIERLYL